MEVEVGRSARDREAAVEAVRSENRELFEEIANVGDATVRELALKGVRQAGGASQPEAGDDSAPV